MSGGMGPVIKSPKCGTAVMWKLLGRGGGGAPRTAGPGTGAGSRAGDGEAPHSRPGAPTPVTPRAAPARPQITAGVGGSPFIEQTPRSCGQRGAGSQTPLPTSLTRQALLPTAQPAGRRCGQPLQLSGATAQAPCSREQPGPSPGWAAAGEAPAGGGVGETLKGRPAGCTERAYRWGEGRGWCAGAGVAIS